MTPFDYFKHCEKKYNLRLSQTQPIVIRFDGMGVTKNPAIDLLDEAAGSFTWALRESARLLSLKFEALVLIGSDEVSFILDPMMAKRAFSLPEKEPLKGHKLLSYIGQDLSAKFNYLYDGDVVYFDGRVFNLPLDKIDTYLAYRHHSTENVMIQYIAKRYLPLEFRRNRPLAELKEALEQQYPDYPTISPFIREGILYVDGICEAELDFLLAQAPAKALITVDESGSTDNF